MRITQENIERLIRNSELKSLYDNTYLTDVDNPNYKYIKSRFFRYEKDETARTLSVGTGLFPTIADIPANYTGNPVSDDKLDIIKCTKDYEIYNYCTVGLVMEEEQGKPVAKVAYLPAEGWFFQDGYNHIARVYRKSVKLGLTDYYILIQRFDNTFTENKLYKMPTGFSLGRGTALDFDNLIEVSLAELDQTADMQEIMSHPFNKPAIYVIKEDKHILYPTGSKIEKVRQQVYAMDRKKVMFDNQFLQNVESFVVLKGINIPDTITDKYQNGGRIDITDLGRYIDADADGSIEFVNNTNALIKDAMESVNKDLKQLSATAKIPLDFLGADIAHGAIGKGSRSLLHGSFTKDIEATRGLWNKYLPNIYEDLSKLNKTDPSYTRPDIFGSSDLEIAEEMTVALNAGIISQSRAIQTYLGLDDDQTELEIEKINLTSKSIDGGQNNGSNTINQEEGNSSENI